MFKLLQCNPDYTQCLARSHSALTLEATPCFLRGGNDVGGSKGWINERGFQVKLRVHAELYRQVETSRDLYDSGVIYSINNIRLSDKI